MNKIYNLLIKSIKHIEVETHKYKKKNEEDIASKRELAKTPLNRQYEFIKKEMVWEKFLKFIDKYHIL